MLTLQEVKDYLGIDYSDDMIDRNLERLIKTADMIMKGGVGENYPADDPRAIELNLIIIDDLYSNRGVDNRTSSNTRKLINDMMFQLKMELRMQNEKL